MIKTEQDITVEFEALAAEASNCQLCPRMRERQAVLSRLNGTLSPLVMFIAEAPGRKGADRTRIPLVGDISGQNFDLFLSSTGLTRQDIFITNAVMCNPREGEKNSKPLSSEITNCRPFLLRQIELLQPPVIATLGAVALMALEAIEPHGLKLDPDAGKAFTWKGRSLVPLYHPSPHVVNGRRRKQQQIADYKAIAEALKGVRG